MNYSVIRKSISKITEKELLCWRSLLASSVSSAQIFSSPEFCTAVDKVQGGVQIIMLKEGESVKLVLPVQKDRGVGGLLGAFSQVGLGISDFFDMVSDEREQYNIAKIFEKAGVRSLYYTHAPSRIKSAYLPLKISGATYRIVTSDPSANIWEVAQKTNPTYWGDAARKLRRLEKELGLIEFSWHEDSQDNFNLLVEAKLAQYAATGHPNAPLFNRGTQQILKYLLSSNNDNCKGLMSVLRAGDRVLALHLGLKTKTHLHNWFPVYINAYARHSPGKVLFMQILKNSKINGVTSFDFGEGLADYKIAAANEVEELGRGLLKIGILGEISAVPRRLRWRWQ